MIIDTAVRFSRCWRSVQLCHQMKNFQSQIKKKHIPNINKDQVDHKLIVLKVFVRLCVLFLFLCFGFCLFDFSSSAITIFRSCNVFLRRSVDDKKVINFLIIDVRKKQKGKSIKIVSNSHENDAQIWRSYCALVFKSVESNSRHL